MNGPFTRANFDPRVFDAARDGSYQAIRHFDVDLTSARTYAAGSYFDVPVSADSIYIDANPLDGNAVMFVQPAGDNVVEVPVYVSPGFILNDQPFTRLRFVNAAQSGKKIRVIYGVGVKFQPGSVAQVSLSGALDNPRFTVTQSRVTVAATSTQIVPANSTRKYLKLVNNSAQAITLNEQGASAVANQGLVLAAGGGWFEWNASVPVNAITGISASGSVSLEVIEGN